MYLFHFRNFKIARAFFEMKAKEGIEVAFETYTQNFMNWNTKERFIKFYFTVKVPLTN